MLQVDPVELGSAEYFFGQVPLGTLLSIFDKVASRGDLRCDIGLDRPYWLSVASSVSNGSGCGKAGPFWSGRIVLPLRGTTLRGAGKPSGSARARDRRFRRLSTPKIGATANPVVRSVRTNWRYKQLAGADHADRRPARAAQLPIATQLTSNQT